MQPFALLRIGSPHALFRFLIFFFKLDTLTQDGDPHYAAYLTNEIIRRNNYSEMERILENAQYYKRKNFEPKSSPTFERELGCP